jgi:hypothetical protein
MPTLSYNDIHQILSSKKEWLSSNTLFKIGEHTYTPHPNTHHTSIVSIQPHDFKALSEGKMTFNEALITQRLSYSGTQEGFLLCEMIFRNQEK